MVLCVGAHVLLEILLHNLDLAPGTLEWTLDWLHRTSLLVLLELRSFHSFLATVVGALDWVVWADAIMTAGDDLVRILKAAVLTFDSPLNALLPKMLLDVLPRDCVPALVWTGDSFVGTPLSGREMIFEPCHVPRPLTALFLMRAVDLELVYPLFEMNVSEMVEARCAAGWAGVVGIDSFLDATLAVVLSAAHHLSWVLQDFVAHLADKFVRNLP